MDFSAFSGLLQEHGPIVGVATAMIYWQSRQINKLLDRNTKILDAEIDRMAALQKWLLTPLLGPPPSSEGSPTVKQLHAAKKKFEAEAEKRKSKAVRQKRKN